MSAESLPEKPETAPSVSSEKPAFTPSERICMMDELRGFAVFCMVFYHAFYTMAFLFHFELGMKLLLFFTPAEPYFAGLFLLISGISSQLSRSNLIRGAKLLAIALVITLVTVLFVPEARILFGILHLLSVAMILFGLLSRPLGKVPVWVGLFFCVLLFLFTAKIGSGVLSLPGLFSLELPKELYTAEFLFPFGIYKETFFSADYFPLFPWIFIYLAGTFLGRFAKQGKFPRFLYPSRVPALSFLGRHALVIYVLHQPIIYGIVWILSLFIPK